MLAAGKFDVVAHEVVSCPVRARVVGLPVRLAAAVIVEGPMAVLVAALATIVVPVPVSVTFRATLNTASHLR